MQAFKPRVNIENKKNVYRESDFEPKRLWRNNKSNISRMKHELLMMKQSKYLSDTFLHFKVFWENSHEISSSLLKTKRTLTGNEFLHNILKKKNEKLWNILKSFWKSVDTTLQTKDYTSTKNASYRFVFYCIPLKQIGLSTKFKRISNQLLFPFSQNNP